MVDLRYSSTSYEEEEQGDPTENSKHYFSDDDESDNNNRSQHQQRYMIRWKSGKRVDPRLLTTLESFKEIYDQKRELFIKIFPGVYKEFIDVFKKLGEMRVKNKEATSMERSRTLCRSYSLGSPRDYYYSSSLEMDDNDELVDERFKVKPPTVIIGGQTVRGRVLF